MTELDMNTILFATLPSVLPDERSKPEGGYSHNHRVKLGTRIEGAATAAPAGPLDALIRTGVCRRRLDGL
jgi:hypothetical protein